MFRKSTVFVLFLIFLPLACAQFTTVSGTVTDPNGLPYAFGTVNPILIFSGGTPKLPSGSPYFPPNQASGLDASGHFVVTLGDNTQLTPGGSLWNFQVCSAAGSVPAAFGKGSVCFTLASPITISGSSQSITTFLTAAALPLTNPFGSTVPAGVAVGSQLVSSGLTLPPVYQVKPFIDMRDLYDCTYATDSAPALNTAWANGANGVDGSQQTFPQNCHLKLGSTWTVQNHTGFLFRGYSSPGAGGTAAQGSPTISYCQSSAGNTLLNFQFANSPTLENLIIDGQGSGCSNGAGTGIVFDKIGPGTANTTFGVMRNVQIVGGITGVHNPAFIGVNFSPAQGANVEDFLIDHSYINCESSGPTTTDTTVGVKFNTFNTKEEQIFNTNFNACATGILTGPGGVRISGGDYGNNKIDIAWQGNADPTVIDDITSENSAQGITSPGGGGGNFPVLISNNHFAPSSAAAANASTVSIGDTANSTPFTLMDNGWDDPSTYSSVTGAFPFSSNQNNHVSLIQNNFVGGANGMSIGASNSVSLTGNSRFILPNGHNFGADYGVFNGGYYRVGGNFSQAGNEDMGFGFYSSLGSDVAGLAYNNSSADGANAGGLAIGRDAMYLANANMVMKGVWAVPSQTVYCGVNGTLGSTRYQIKVFGKDSGNNRSGWVDYVGNAAACFNAQATFTASNSITITWQPVAGETNGYDVVVMNPAASTTQGWLAGSTAHGTTTLTVTSGPGAFNYVFPNYYDTARTIMNGRFQIRDMGTCTMAAGTCPAQNLASTYAAAPLCFLTWNGSGTLTGILKAPSTTSQVTPASTVNTDTAQVNWACYGN